MQPAGNWSHGWNRKRFQTERRNGTFGFRCYTALYAIEAKEVGRIKFGVTADVDKRYRQLCNGSPVELELVGHIWAPSEFEGGVFEFLKDDRIWGEWFLRTERSRSIAALIGAKMEHQLAAAIGMESYIPKDAELGHDDITRLKF